MRKTKRKLKKNLIRNIFLTFLFIIFIASTSLIVFYTYKSKQEAKENTNILDKIEINETDITPTKTKRMLQLAKLQQENSDIIGWLEIPDTNINYPILKTDNNDFYINHNYKKEKNISGSLFLDKDFNLKDGSTNYLIYGHRMENGTMFEDLMKYTDVDFYEQHKTITFTTNKEESTYEVIAAFYSRVYYQSEKNVFRYYYFVNADNEEEYNNFVNNVKKVSLYDTGVTATYGEQLMTLSTCSYHTDNGRFAVVLKKI